MQGEAFVLDRSTCVHLAAPCINYGVLISSYFFTPGVRLDIQDKR